MLGKIKFYEVARLKTRESQ